MDCCFDLILRLHLQERWNIWCRCLLCYMRGHFLGRLLRGVQSILIRRCFCKMRSVVASHIREVIASTTSHVKSLSQAPLCQLILHPTSENVALALRAEKFNVGFTNCWCGFSYHFMWWCAHITWFIYRLNPSIIVVIRSLGRLIKDLKLRRINISIRSCSLFVCWYHSRSTCWMPHLLLVLTTLLMRVLSAINCVS